MDDRLLVLKVAYANGAFGMERLKPADCRRLPRPERDVFTVALVLGPIDGEDAEIAFDCDFMAVSTVASIVTDHANMLRRRVGTALGAGVELEMPLSSERLRALGLAIFLIDADLQAAERRVLRQAETLLALAQSRRVSAPDWFNRQ